MFILYVYGRCCCSHLAVFPLMARKVFHMNQCLLGLASGCVRQLAVLPLMAIQVFQIHVCLLPARSKPVERMIAPEKFSAS